MKWMFRLVFLLAALWSGYWYFGARAQEKAYAELLTESRNQGWTAESRHLGVSGFPNRFDTTLTDLNFADPSGRFRWHGEEFQIMALSYQPNHIIMAWPGKQVVETPQGEATINADLLRASLVVSPAISLPLSRFQIEGNDVALQGPELGDALIGHLNGALFQDENQANTYHFGLDLTDIAPPETLTARLGGGQFFSGGIDRLHISAHLEFDKPLDRLALEDGQPPRPVRAEIEPSLLVWGTAELGLRGTLSKGENGFVEGELFFDVKNWQQFYDLFKQASHLTPTELITMKKALNSVANGNNLVFSLRFENGESLIGPFTIGPAPVYPL